jgi:hypothetical protein
MRISKALCVLGVLGLVLALPSVTMAASISNGSFDDTNGAAAPDPSSADYNGVLPPEWEYVTWALDWFLPPVSPTLAAWRLAEGTPASPDGGAFVLGREFNDIHFEAFRQEVTGFTVGQTVTLRFWQANAGNGTGQYAGDPSVHHNSGYWSVSAWDETHDSNVSAWQGVGNQTWSLQSVSFTADTTDTFFTFTPGRTTANSVNEYNGVAMAIDGVSFVNPAAAVVPVPAAAWIGLALLAGLGIVRRLRRRQPRTGNL